MRVELGSGERPTPGFVATDIYPHPRLDLCAPAWELDYPDESVSEVLALGVMEHLRPSEFTATVRNVRRMLVPGGSFVFDVPDLVAWCRYLVDAAEGRPTPFPLDHILKTLYGWDRWPGDEHKSGWTRDLLLKELEGFTVSFGVEQFVLRGHDRRRFGRPADAHIYVVAVK